MSSNLTFDLTFLEKDRVRIVVSYLNIKELGTLYFEPPKRSWNNKPLMNMKWACVDAKVEGLYEVGGEMITPKDIVGMCQDLISSHQRQDQESTE
jgi:hypothetical protein